MTYLVMLVVLLVSSLLQVQMPGYAIFGGTKIPFLIAVVLYYALSCETGIMLVAAVCAGFLQDSLSQVPLGYSSLLFCIFGLIVGRFRKYVMVESLVTSIFFGGLISLIFNVVLYIWIASDGLVSYGGGRLFMRFVGVGLLGMMCTPILFLFARTLDQLVGNIELAEEIDVFE